MKDGGYDIGYKNCSCFWGTKPGSLVKRLDEYISDFHGLKVIDLGCGEGKNSFYLAEKGCNVDAYDISQYAINNTVNCGKNEADVNFKVKDITDLNLPINTYDIVIAYGLYHCFNSLNEVIRQIQESLNTLKQGGLFIICAFNKRKHDLKAHNGFQPLLLEHSKYVELFVNYTILYETDEDLYEIHPHNNIPHFHSMTRLIIKK